MKSRSNADKLRERLNQWQWYAGHSASAAKNGHTSPDGDARTGEGVDAEAQQSEHTPRSGEIAAPQAAEVEALRTALDQERERAAALQTRLAREVLSSRESRKRLPPGERDKQSMTRVAEQPHVTRTVITDLSDPESYARPARSNKQDNTVAWVLAALVLGAVCAVIVFVALNVYS